jgi:hypothetical protein
MANLPVAQPLDGNGRTIEFAGFDPSTGQFIVPATSPATVPSGQNFSVAALQFAPVDGGKASYAAAISGLVPAASATDIFTITGSATKTVRVIRVEVSGIATTILDTSVALIVRSSADLTGTSTSPAAVPYDSTNAAATATIKAYTANPGTLGTTVGTIRSSKLLFNLAAPTAGSESGRLIEDFGDRPTQAVVLRGVAQVLAVNLAGVTVAGGSVDISIEFTEE